MAFSDHRQRNVGWCLFILILSTCPRGRMFVVCRRQTICSTQDHSHCPSIQQYSFLWSEKPFLFLCLSWVQVMMKFCLCSTTWMSHYNTYLRTVWSTNIQFGQNLFISLRKLANPSQKLQITHGKMYFYEGLPNWILRWVRVHMETIIFNCLGFQRA